jgi:hypothetical protein
VKNPAENAQDPATDDLLLADSSEDDDEPILEEPAAVRQGLPAGFRMRHDRHYVDELVGMRVAAASRQVPQVVEPAAALRDKPDDAARTLRAALGLIADRLDVLSHHANADRRSPLGTFDRALRIELDRAARVARAAETIAGDVPLARREVTAGEMAERVMHAIRPARRFSGVRFKMSVEDASYRIVIDAGETTRAIAGAVDAFCDLLSASRHQDNDDPVVQLKVHGVQPRPALMIEIAASGLGLSEEALATFFDATPAVHSAATERTLLLNAAARIARAHGGRADVRRGDDGEVVALFVLPAVV